MTRQEAERRMDQAKRQFTRATMAALQGLPLAEQQVTAALAELTLARNDLAKLESAA